MAAALRAAGHEAALLPLVTTGDRWSPSGGPPPDRGLFVNCLLYTSDALSLIHI